MQPAPAAFDGWLGFSPPQLRCEDEQVDPQSRHFGPIATPSGDADALRIDIGSLVRRLILFEHCIVESNRLREVPALVATFGVGGLLELLDSGAVGVLCDALTFGQVGQIPWLGASEIRGGPLPIGAYRLSTVTMGDRGEYVHGVLQEVHKAAVPFKEVKRLKRALADRLLAYPAQAGQSALADVNHELRRQEPVLWDAIGASLEKATGLRPGADPAFRVHPLEQDGDFRIETNLGEVLHVEPEMEHRVVERAILGLAGLDLRLRLMEDVDAVTGFREAEATLFEQKLRYVASLVDPAAQEARFDRVVRLAGLPLLNDLPANARIDAHALLRLRERDECRGLRAWIRTVDSRTDDAITADFGRLRDDLASVTRSPLGRVVRFIVPAALGLVPGPGTVAGLGLSGADTFLLDRVLGRPGPAAFLAEHYPSIFLDGSVTKG